MCEQSLIGGRNLWRGLRASTVLVVVTACASVKTEGVVIRGSAADAAPHAPAALGQARRRVQVLRLSVPKEFAEQYKELTDRRVGWGLSNLILEGLYETGRFDFIEEKDSVLKRMADQWKMSDAGLVSEQTRVAPGSLTGAEYIAYAEVYNFSVAKSEKITGIASATNATTIVGVQMRLVDALTGEYVTGLGEGDATQLTSAIWISSQTPFDQTTVGIATRRAVNVALDQLLRRAMARGII